LAGWLQNLINFAKMIFNSIDFAWFLPIVFIVYWLIGPDRYKIQNIFIVLSSYVFYGWWDYRFLFLLFISSLGDYLLALAILKHPKKSRLFLTYSIILNLGLLAYFKYFNFFIDSFLGAFTLLGFTFGKDSLEIILPVGISFYTFQTLSYTIDVFRKNLEPTRDVFSFFAYVSFFPQLVAGPIERATHLLPQFLSKRKFDYSNAVYGCRQMLWGFFKKMVIADSCSKYVNMIFAHYEVYHWSILLFGSMLFAIQIYGDFSGYSDIAIGISRLFGFTLMNNFNFPYFSRDVAEFWRRWHISLTTWFRDYVYIPLGGSRENLRTTLRNTGIVFLVSGFWHGANWTFILWGLLHALLFVPLLISGKNRRFVGVENSTQDIKRKLIDFVRMSITFLVVSLAWIFFRSSNVGEAFNYFALIFTFSDGLTELWRFPMEQLYFLVFMILIGAFVLMEWINRGHIFALGRLPKSKVSRWIIYLVIATSTFIFSGESSEFIYFQF
jgi:alginate O-acetyltransferase complex protein AlgI